MVNIDGNKGTNSLKISDNSSRVRQLERKYADLLKRVEKLEQQSEDT